MYYFNANTNTPLTEEQLNDLYKTNSLDKTKTLYEQNIFDFNNKFYPQRYLDYPDLFDVETFKDENGKDTYTFIEYGLTVEDPNDPTKTIVKHIKEYRFNWKLVAKDKDITKPIILNQLANLKKEIEDAGVTLPDGTVIQSTSADRDRIMQLMLSYTYLDIFNTSDTDFANLLNELKFKITAGNWRIITRNDIMIFFKVMAERTLNCFKRENEISNEIEIAYNNNDNERLVWVYFNSILVGWPN